MGLSPYISPVMTAVTSKMNRMVLLYTLILSMVSLPTSLPKHLLVETADKGGDDYFVMPSRPRPSPSPPFFPSHDYGMEKQNKGSENNDKTEKKKKKKGEDYCFFCPPQDYRRLPSRPIPYPPNPKPQPRRGQDYRPIAFFS